MQMCQALVNRIAAPFDASCSVESRRRSTAVGSGRCDDSYDRRILLRDCSREGEQREQQEKLGKRVHPFLHHPGGLF
jgi:hypothetical protein